MLEPTSEGTCTDCGGPVRTIITAETGRRVELDPEPHPAGTVVPVLVDGRLVGRVLDGGQLPAQVPAWRRHDATCPRSAAARRHADRTAPRCTACQGKLDPVLARVEPHHDEHPSCDTRAAAALVRYAARRSA